MSTARDAPMRGELARLPVDMREMIARGVSAIVGSCSADGRPSLMRAVGGALADDGQSVAVYLDRPQARQVLADIEAGGAVAVVFSQPTTHRTVQLKARGARLRAAGAHDQPVLAAYLRAMERELQAVGIAPPMAAAMLAHRLEDVVVVQFAPEQCFDQTPGPRAGARL